ncbi:hypothetical protein AGLY_010093 [Aphis glycines]|uniref:Uncharacterized protein n=1 Tax=Aphis glycines TaxID=307491 RepID=A0A6G0TFM6_APHGL|nr:hypothetical protein AGLY_010093 [Aphis glycines]
MQYCKCLIFFKKKSGQDIYQWSVGGEKGGIHEFYELLLIFEFQSSNANKKNCVYDKSLSLRDFLFEGKLMENFVEFFNLRFKYKHFYKISTLKLLNYLPSISNKFIFFFQMEKRFNNYTSTTRLGDRDQTDMHYSLCGRMILLSNESADTSGYIVHGFTRLIAHYQFSYKVLNTLHSRVLDRSLRDNIMDILIFLIKVISIKYINLMKYKRNTFENDVNTYRELELNAIDCTHVHETTDGNGILYSIKIYPMGFMPFMAYLHTE